MSRKRYDYSSPEELRRGSFRHLEGIWIKGAFNRSSWAPLWSAQNPLRCSLQK